jgi:hypothetical protein
MNICEQFIEGPPLNGQLQLFAQLLLVEDLGQDAGPSNLQQRVNLDWQFSKRGPLKGSLSIDENRQTNRRRKLITKVS